MPETDLETANTKLAEWATKFSTLESSHVELSTKFTDLTTEHTTMVKSRDDLGLAVESKQLELTKLQESSKNNEAAVTALQTKLTETEAKVGDTELPTKFEALTKDHDELKTKFSNGSKARLKAHGLGDELLTDKSQSELDAMESALLTVVKPAGTNPVGLGLTGSGSAVPAATTILEHEAEVIKRAKHKAGVPV